VAALTEKRLPDNSTNNNRIAKNTILPHFRTLLTMIMEFYTSMAVLDALVLESRGSYIIVDRIE
jgi:hypothetical protein